MRGLSGLVTGVVSTIVESAEELRIHRTRVLLSLIGIAVAICALTTVMGAGAVATQALVESSERSGGRAATISVSANGTEGPLAGTQAEQFDALWRETAERHELEYWTRFGWGQTTAQFVDGGRGVQASVVDPDYGVMNRVSLVQGSWFAADDATRLAPAVVVNEPFWEHLGSPPIDSHPTVELRGAEPVTAVVIGVARSADWEQESLYVLADTYLDRELADPSMGYGTQLEYRAWVDRADADAFQAALESELAAAVPDGVFVSAYRSDFGEQNAAALAPVQLMISGVAVLILVLGALGLVNIALVTVKHRIREIGIRRSFGATSGRVFFAVLMESVVGSIVAGAIGVAIAILIVKSPFFEDLVGQGMVDDFPPFPIEAAVIGILASTAVGALAGLLPALAAVRVRVIDAIRF